MGGKSLIKRGFRDYPRGNKRSRNKISKLTRESRLADRPWFTRRPRRPYHSSSAWRTNRPWFSRWPTLSRWTGMAIFARWTASALWAWKTASSVWTLKTTFSNLSWWSWLASVTLRTWRSFSSSSSSCSSKAL